MHLTTFLGAADVTSHNDWMNTTIGKWLVALLAILGGIIVVVAIFRAVGAFLKGDVAKGAKTLAGAAVLAAFMFMPSLITGLINFVGDLVSKVLDTGSEVGKTGGGGGTGNG